MASKKPFSISALLDMGGQRLGALRAGAERARSTLTQVEAALPADLQGKVHGASFDTEGVLNILVDSGAYATRLRYSLPEILPRVLNDTGQAASRGKVRVRPRDSGRA
jgi:hypothetical protein